MIVKKTASLAERMRAIDCAEHKRASGILRTHGFNPPPAVAPIEDYEQRYATPPDWRRVLADREDVAAGRVAPKDAEPGPVDVDKLKRARAIAARTRVLIEDGLSFEEASAQALKEAEAAPDETDDDDDDSIEAQARRGREIIRRCSELTRAGSSYADAHQTALEESRKGKRRTVAVRVTRSGAAPAQRAGLGREQHAAATKQLERQRGVSPAKAAELLSDSVNAANDATETALLRRVGVDLSGCDGRNAIERTMAFLRAQPDGDVGYDEIHRRACELVRAAKVAS